MPPAPLTDRPYRLHACPAGSGGTQPRYRFPGKYGHASPCPIVITTSEARTVSSVSDFGVSAARPHPARAQLLQERGGPLGPPCLVHAHAQDSELLRHRGSASHRGTSAGQPA